MNTHDAARAAQRPEIFPGAYMELGLADETGDGPDVLTKTERPGMNGPATREAAEVRAAALLDYYAALQELGVPVAPVMQVEVVRHTSGSYCASYRMQLIDEPSLDDLTRDHSSTESARLVRQGLNQIINMLCRMPVFASDPDRLAVGIDVLPANWRFDSASGRFLLVDIYPSLLRDRDGRFSVGNSDYFDVSAGTVSGAIAQLLLRTYHVFGGGVMGETVFRLDPYIDEWRELVPPELLASVAAAIRLNAQRMNCRLYEPDLERLAAGTPVSPSTRS